MINTHTERMDPRALTPLELNAHFMRHEVFARLVENIRADGTLTGNTPFAWRIHDDTSHQPTDPPQYLVLSGNHRVRASIVAGLEAIDVTLTEDYLPPDRRRAIQLSHNAIFGEDDPATLKTIYESISDHTMKLYSGLDDKHLSLMTEIGISSLSEANLTFQTISLTFLPDELTAVTETFEQARKLVKVEAHWLARWADYDRMMDALEATSQAYNVKNTATLFMLILNIFMQHRDDLTDGYLTAEGEASAPRQQVPLSSILPADTLPAATAAKLKRVLARLDKDPLIALDQLADLGAAE